MGTDISGVEVTMLIPVGRNEKMIKEYIQNQLKEDYYSDQISLKEYYDPFTGESVPKSK